MSNGHHYFSPSTHYRAFNCPASVMLSSGQPEEVREDATEGTRIHALIAEMISTGCWPDGADNYQRHLNAAQTFTRRVEDEAGPGGGKWEAERQLIFCIPSGNGTKRTAFTGTADAVLIVGNVGYILDWKTGAFANQRDTSTQYQLRAYAASLCQALDLDAVHAAAAYTATGDHGEAVTVRREDLPELEQRYAEILAKVDAGTEFAPCTGDWCQFCKCKRVCHVVQREAEKARNALILPQGMKLATVEDADLFLMRCNAVYAFLDAGIDRAKDMIRAAGGSEHYKVGKPVQTKRVDWKKVTAMAKIPQAIIEECTTVTESEARLTLKK